MTTTTQTELGHTLYGKLASSVHMLRHTSPQTCDVCFDGYPLWVGVQVDVAIALCEQLEVETEIQE